MQPLTVSELTDHVKNLVEAAFPYAWVVGEISNCTGARSGHIYFTLKDDEAQLRAVMWRSRASRLRFDVHDGLEVIAAGPIEVYKARGGYQIVVEELVPQGVGALELAFRQLQQKLAAEGLFDPARKRPLPRYPRRIALVTSPTGAAVHDMLQVLTRRWQATNVVIVPVPVQGDGAAPQIAAGLERAARLPEVDLIITGRGGGSLEDLWPFNEEVVARAIARSPIPVISAVGHEIDVSIADLVADRRALTPTEAAEIAVPNRVEVAGELRRLEQRLTASLRERAVRARLQLDAMASRRVFTNPLQRVHDLAARLDDLDERVKRRLARRITDGRQRLAALGASLDALSPLAVLNRGYSITRRAGGEVVRTAESVQTGEELVTLLGRGRLRSTVTAIDTDEMDGNGREPAVRKASQTNGRP